MVSHLFVRIVRIIYDIIYFIQWKVVDTMRFLKRVPGERPLDQYRVLVVMVMSTAVLAKGGRRTRVATPAFRLYKFKLLKEV